MLLSNADRLRLKKIVMSEVNVRSMTGTKIYQFVIRNTNSIEIADQFMLSEGWTKGDIRRFNEVINRAKTFDFNNLIRLR